MKITPLIAESMGTRSMATFIETKDLRLLIDPGAVLGKLRFGLPPHPLEKWCLKKHLERIHLFSQSANAIVITHYHDDHFIYDSEILYQDKVLFLKNPNQNIEAKEREYAFQFIRRIQGQPKEIRYIDGRTLRIGSTIITFSEPNPHGGTSQSDNGYIIQLCVQEEEDRFLFSSDVYGYDTITSLDFVMKQKPTLLYLDGPITYLRDNESRQNLTKILQSLSHLSDIPSLRTIIIDHHATRDLNWRNNLHPFIKQSTDKNKIIQTASEYRGQENNLLEARREQLYKNEKNIH